MSDPLPAIRCSSLDQLLECPGSRTLIERIRNLRVAAGLAPDPDDSGPQTWAGNWCHWEAARRLFRDHGAVCTQGLPERANVPADFQPTDFDYWCVEYYVSKVLDFIGPDMAIEVENELAFDIGPCVLSGHQDLFAISADGRRGVGVDLKRGANPVDPASQNWQMSGYTVLDRFAYPDLEHMTYLIVQPGIPETDITSRVTSMVLEGEELAMLPEFLGERIAVALENAFTLNTGWRQCLYCLAARTYNCPALDAELEAMKLEITKESVEAMKAEPDVEQLARWKIAQKLLAGRMDDASDLLKAHVIAAGGSLVTAAGSFAVKPRSGIRSIQTEAGWNRLCDIIENTPPKVGVTPYDCISLSASKVERAIQGVYGLPATSKKGPSAESKFEELFGDITTTPVSQVLHVS